MEGQNESFFGFDSVGDFFSSLLGLKNILINLIFVFAALMTQFITGYVWDTSSAIYTLWALMLGDWLTGVYAAKLTGTFSSKRLPRMAVYFVGTSFMIAISWWLAKASLLFYPLPSIVYGVFCSTYFVSLVENFVKIGILPKAVEVFIKNKFGLETLIQKYKNNDTNPTGESVK